MDRRVLVKSLVGVAGAGALALILPPQAEALVGLTPKAPTPELSVLPDLEKLNEAVEEGDDLDENVELASHMYGHHRRRRHRRWRWRRYCRREWWHHHWRRRCRRRRIGFWIWI
jgi:hypothetical protein